MKGKPEGSFPQLDRVRADFRPDSQEALCVVTCHAKILRPELHTHFLSSLLLALIC